MSSTIRSSPPTATVDAQQAEDYRRGREEGTAWARDFATIDELRGFIARYESRQDGDYGSQYWRGFLGAAQEVLNALSRGQAAE